MGALGGGHYKRAAVSIALSGLTGPGTNILQELANGVDTISVSCHFSDDVVVTGLRGFSRKEYACLGVKKREREGKKGTKKSRRRPDGIAHE